MHGLSSWLLPLSKKNTRMHFERLRVDLGVMKNTEKLQIYVCGAALMSAHLRQTQGCRQQVSNLKKQRVYSKVLEFVRRIPIMIMQ